MPTSFPNEPERCMFCSYGVEHAGKLHALALHRRQRYSCQFCGTKAIAMTPFPVCAQHEQRQQQLRRDARNPGQPQ